MLGVDHLALGHRLYPVDDVIATTPKGYALGCFSATFGDALPAIRKCLGSGKFSALRVHLYWDPHHATNPHAIVPIPLLQARVPPYQRLALDFPNVKMYLSHSCEYHEMDRGQIQARVDVIRRLAPACFPVNTPMPPSPVTGNIVVEHHGDVDVKATEIVSMDGVDISQINTHDWLHKNADSLISFGWCAAFNMIQLGHPAPPPMARTFVPSHATMVNVVNKMQGH